MTTTAPPPRKVWTEQEIQALPDDGYNHEIVDGELVMSPKNNWQHGDICARLLSAMHAHVRAHRLGAVFDSSTRFWVANRNCRAPDISFVARERLLGLDRRAPCFIQGAPDLAVEVLSPDLTRRELDARLRDFFASGTRLAWVIDPGREFVEVCHSPVQRGLVPAGGALDGEDVLPGFAFRIADLFTEWDW
ncbi:MAG TPA: Uma2 family endonuclease [Verrucomicrobiota bacterium]|nr:Uma2 family endonuclease [Verrucomicrobiota bacterium]